MKAAILTSFGPPGSLKIRDVPPPVLQKGMVRVRVRAVGLNFADVFARLGVYPGIPQVPFIPGIEFTGVVVERAKDVRGIRTGDRVTGFSRQGAYAEEVCVPARFVFRVPRSMPDVTAASFLVSYLTAWYGMRTLAKARKEEVVLLHAVAGGVGTAALQLGKTWGCRMIGTASTAGKLDVARAHGAEYVVNYAEKDFEAAVRGYLGGDHVDIVMDSVGGKVMKKSLRLLAPKGRYVLYGLASAAGKKRMHYLRLLREMVTHPVLVPTSLPSRNLSILGFNLYFLADRPRALREAITAMLRLYRSGKIDPVVGKVFPFGNVVEAHEYLQARRSMGKVVLTF